MMSPDASRVLPLRKQVDWTIGERPDVARFLAMPHFSAFIVVRRNYHRSDLRHNPPAGCR
ncbi:hypothetical protein NKG60_30165 [Mesorhizobium sp. M1428]|uniref:hypothetical protein n=1 Tax=Mesorhizobium sp. M1428 TaxID=2957102 RepID=UPI00333695FA